ncbi:3-deoxy-7-phosphoheptulonate synthase [soil metagenome]
MIIITRPDITDEQLDQIRERVESCGLRTHISRGEERTIVGCIGDERLLAEVPLLSLPGVDSVTPVLKPYKLVSSESTATPTVVRVGDATAACIGGNMLSIIAGPCSVEGGPMLLETATAVKAAGAAILRGGVFKPRSSPYAFQGMGAEGLELLAEVRAKTGLPVVTEVLDTRHVELLAAHADMLQIGARNMQNFALLAEVGRIQRPVLLKRGLSATLVELLNAAEYIMAAGNRNVVLCERGIRTFEPMTRNTLDVAAIPILKRETHLPVIVDPSHAGGRADLVAPLAFAAIAAGADGLIIEVHPEPSQALSDGDQSLTPAAFRTLMDQLAAFATASGRTLQGPETSAAAAKGAAA